MNLELEHFDKFFRSIHNFEPFPWQKALVERLSDSDTWPDVLDLPTGAGKTAALDAAVFHLALRVDDPSKAAVRIALVVDRRLVVDDAFNRARKIERALCDALSDGETSCPVVKEVAERLQCLAGCEAPPLVAKRLRGGAPLEHDWARTPTQPTVLCSTVDQIGSRLLFRGYGVTDRMKPVHAGLLGTGTLILLDEAHIAEPFRQTLQALDNLGQTNLQLVLLSATPGIEAKRPLELSPQDRSDPTLRARLEACKVTTLKAPVRGGADAAIRTFAIEARQMAERFRERGASPVVIAVVVNRVNIARGVFEVLEDEDSIESVLLIGPSRSIDREKFVEGAIALFRTGNENRATGSSLFIVATQCLEVGVDLDLDGLVTQAASLDALRQRFGRLNRAGRDVQAEGVIITLAEDISKKADDAVYGDRIRLTWEALQSVSENDKVDFGVEKLTRLLEKAGPIHDNLASERPNAPVLMPAYLDLWSQTSPRPTADPEIGLFLHGARRMVAGVSIVWRSDLSEEDMADERERSTTDVMRLVPARAAEMIEIPIWVAREWLRGAEGARSDLSDSPEVETESRPSGGSRTPSRRAFRWAGYDQPDTGCVGPRDLRPGDLLIVPSAYGGCDQYGWSPKSQEPVSDVADDAARPFWRTRCAVRITRDIVAGESSWIRVSRLLMAEELSGTELVQHLLQVLESERSESLESASSVRPDVLDSLNHLREASGQVEVHRPYADPYGGGVILVAPTGVNASQQGEGDKAVEHPAVNPATEDEETSNTASVQVLLDDHGARVERFATRFAKTLGLEEIADDLSLAAYLHDAGKADPRFQTMLVGGDPWNRPNGPPLAKSIHTWSPQSWKRANLPNDWRHEALSVRMAQTHPRFSEARDPALVLWLIGSHHGLGRPFFNFLDPSPEKPKACLEVSEWQLSDDVPGPQSPNFDFEGFDWPSLFEELKLRYGIWGLAHLEAILRLADHRASQEEENL